MRFHRVAALIAVTLGCARAAFASDAASLLQLTDDKSVDLQTFIAAGGRCGTVDLGPGALPSMPAKGELETLSGTIAIPVAFHVIYKESSKNGKLVRTGDVPDAQIDAQLRVLNEAYARTGITFTKRSVDRKKSSTWYAMKMGSKEERDAKAALAIDPTHVLNVYTAGLGNSLLGWAYFPWAYPEASTMHGLVVLYSTLPGGSAAPYNLGHTATHEIGHYLGLLHTFQGGCRAPGDYVSDTPDEATPAYGCPSGRNTCLTAGLDPVTNFMDYTDDACMTTFTAGQETRMRWAIQSYRRGLPAPVTAESAAGRVPVAAARLLEVSPNPFNPTTRVAFQLDRATHVSLHVFDVAGRQVARLLEADLPAGRHEAIFEGRQLASGVYMAVLDAGDARDRQRLVLLK